MRIRYPSPCLKCTKQIPNDSCTQYRNCRKYNGWIKWWWKRFRAFRLEEKKRTQNREKFCYAHPDEIRRELLRHPCEGCKVESSCERPCERYLAWYDARMEIVRKKVGT